jgi:hypothetical protein
LHGTNSIEMLENRGGAAPLKVGSWLMDAILFPAFAIAALLYGQDLRVPPKIETMKNPMPATPSVLGEARGIYEENCLRCHGLAGRGDGPDAKPLPIKPVNLSDAGIMAGMTDGKIFWAISEGIQFMPSFSRKLTEKQRWGLVRLLRSMSNTEPNQKPKPE